jgi:hypothetical protein
MTTLSILHCNNVSGQRLGGDFSEFNAMEHRQFSAETPDKSFSTRFSQPSMTRD